MIPTMPEASAHHAPHSNDRLIALFLLGVVAFLPPLLRVFGGPATLFGWPLLFIYMFLAWAVIVVLIAIDVESRNDNGKQRPDKGTQAISAD